jgi:hypothetical protein
VSASYETEYSDESAPGFTQFRTGALGFAYNEAAFRYFLSADRQRVEQWNGSLLLILAALQQRPGRSTQLTESTASALFAEMGNCLREIDFVGWYRQDRVVAAVLPQDVRLIRDVSDRIVNRVLHALQQRLTADQARQLRVRAVTLGGLPESHTL